MSEGGGGDDKGGGGYEPPDQDLTKGYVPPEMGGGEQSLIGGYSGGGSLDEMASAGASEGYSGGYSGDGYSGGGGGGTDIPSTDFGGGYSGGDGGDLPPNASLTSGSGGPQWNDTLTSAANVTGPAGTGGAPDVAALGDVGDETGGTASDLGGFSADGVASGPSAAGAAPYTVGGAGSTDLSSQKREKTDKTDADWLTSLGIKNPVGAAIAGAGLGYNMIKGQTQPQPVQDLSRLAQDLRNSTGGITPEGRAIATTGASNLNTRAGELDPMSQELQNRGAGLTKYVGTGTLPPEMQAQVDQATKDAKLARISFYASRGQPVDPLKNTSLRSDLEGIDRQAVIMASTMASDLAKTGTSIADTGLKGNQLAGGYQKSAADIGTSMVNSGIQASGLQSQAYNQLAQIDAAQADRTQKAIAAMAAALSGGPQVTNLRLT